MSGARWISVSIADPWMRPHAGCDAKDNERSGSASRSSTQAVRRVRRPAGLRTMQPRDESRGRKHRRRGVEPLVRAVGVRPMQLAVFSPKSTVRDTKVVRHPVEIVSIPVDHLGERVRSLPTSAQEIVAALYESLTCPGTSSCLQLEASSQPRRGSRVRPARSQEQRRSRESLVFRDLFGNLIIGRLSSSETRRRRGATSESTASNSKMRRPLIRAEQVSLP